MLLRQADDTDYRYAVITQALNHRPHASSQVRQRFDQTMRQYFTIPGFSNPGRGPLPKLRATIAKHWAQLPDLVGATLGLWAESNAELRTYLVSLLADTPYPVTNLARQIWQLHGTFPAIWADHLAQTIVAAKPTYDVRDVRLMLVYLTGRVAEEATSNAEAVDEATVMHDDSSHHEDGSDGSESDRQHDRWETYLIELGELPIDAPEWMPGRWESFIRRVEALIEQRRTAEHIVYQELGEALEFLRTSCAETLAFFGFVDATTWSAEACDRAVVPSCTEAVVLLQSALSEYHQEVQQVRPTSFGATRERRERLEALEETILRTHETLAALLCGEPTPPMPPDEIDVDEQEEPGNVAVEETDVASEPVSLRDTPEPVVPSGQAASPVKGDPLVNIQPEVPDTLFEVDLASGPIADVSEVDSVEQVSPLAEASAAEPSSEQSANTSSLLPDVLEPSIMEGDTSDVGETLDTASNPGCEAATSDFIATNDTGVPTTVDAPPSSDDEREVGPETLLPPRELAQHILSTDSGWEHLLWSLLEQNDLAGAYWLARALDDAGCPSPVPAPLIAALQGSQWLQSSADLLVDELHTIATRQLVDDSDPHRILALAAALRPVVVAPATGMQDWLRVPISIPHAHGLVTALQQFAETGIALRQEDLQGLASADERDAAMKDLSTRARRWLTEAPGRRAGYARATEVWRRMVTSRDSLRGLMEYIADDRRGELARAQEWLATWSDRAGAIRQIDALSKIGVRGRWEPIDGPARESLLAHVDEACELASTWCDLVAREQQINRRGDWIMTKASGFREQVRITSTPLATALDEMARESQPRALQVAITCLRRALSDLGNFLNLVSERQPLLPAISPVIPPPYRTLGGALNRWLLWLPEHGDMVSSSPTLRTTIATSYAEGRTLRMALDGWLARQDYRYVVTLLEGDDASLDLVEDPRRVQEARRESQIALQRVISETESAIEEAHLDGLLDADARAQYSGQAASIAVESVEAFQPAYAQVQAIRDELRAVRTGRMDELTRQWTSLQTRLAASHIPAEHRELVQEFVARSLNEESNNTRVVEECFALVTEAIESGEPLDVDLFVTSAGGREVLSDYLATAPRIRDWLNRAQNLGSIEETIAKGRSRQDVSFGDVPPPRRKEAVEALRSWRGLKQTSPERRLPSSAHICTVLSYLGFTLDRDDTTTVQMSRHGDDWVHVRVRMRAGTLAKPIPQFGSRVGERYDVICLWERPGADTIAVRLQELRLTMQSVIVIYLGRMSPQQWRDVSRLNHAHELAAALLDEVMLVYLARTLDASLRLPTFLRCTLPTAALNPYTPFQAGDVPLEMFFGREAMVRELQRVNGSCIMYGGRQLGKSALLRRVQREFHHPERQQFAWVEDIKLIGDPLAGQPATELIWRRIRDGLKQAGVLPSRVSTEKSEEIERHIREALRQNQERRVIILFDEADNFLDADARANFRIVERLRTLMFDTQRRFKVVFAGLHNVQRFQGIPNQPLAHFGTPIRVGPLEADAALQLVREPLEALGYRFQTDGLALRILSYTNYHSGLIQLFCHDLLRQLHAQYVPGDPPYIITQREIESIYRQVRERIRERFDWTLALDPRYQAIAWSMIVDQLSLSETYDQAYPVGLIHELVRTWWADGFAAADQERVRSLLDEMCGLGVLVRTVNGHYRLRSPNLVRLVGSVKDVEDRLIELASRSAPVAFLTDEHHTPVNDATPILYSPLTHGQERSLTPQTTGVGLIFASEALGLEHIPTALRRFVPVGGADRTATWEEIPSQPRLAERIAEVIDKIATQNGNFERVFVYHEVDEHLSTSQLERLVSTTISSCQRPQRRTRRNWMRVFLVMGPASLVQWLALPVERREKLEALTDAVITPHRWNDVGIQPRLEQSDKLSTADVGRRLLEVTGGWPILLDELFLRSEGAHDPRPVAAALQQELRTSGSPLAARFHMALGIAHHPAADAVLAFLRREGEVPRELVTPDFVDSAAGLTQEQCDQALLYLERLGCIQVGKHVTIEAVVSQVWGA